MHLLTCKNIYQHIYHTIVTDYVYHAFIHLILVYGLLYNTNEVKLLNKILN